MRDQTKKVVFNKMTLLIVMCWIVYACSYLGKLGYNANIIQIENNYCISHSTAGIVSTFFFFAYGVGQLINGIFCKKYNVRLIVFSSLIASGLMNLLVGISKDFTFIKYFWLINGASLSVLWPSLIRVLSETLDKENIARAVVVMGTTTAMGTFLVYGLSALFVALGAYEIIFFLAGILLPLIALMWFFSYPKLVKEKIETGERGVQPRTDLGGKKKLGYLWIPMSILAVFAVFNHLVKDGLTTWVPMILKEVYALPDSISILLTIVLPILAIFGVNMVVILYKKIKDFVIICATLFLMSAVCIGLAIFCMPMGWGVIMLISFGIVSCLMAGVNNIITSMMPLYWKEKINSGLMAGVLNGFCYLGSTLSAYGLGLIADIGGWNSVFWLLLSICAVAVCISVCYGIVKNVRKSKNVFEV